MVQLILRMRMVKAIPFFSLNTLILNFLEVSGWGHQFIEFDFTS